jgi:integrase
MATRLADATEYGTLTSLIPSWERSLRLTNKSPETTRSYGDSARLLKSFLRDSFGVTSVAGITRDHIETFMADTLERWKPTTAAVRYRSLQQLFKWLNGEVPTDPMARMRPPAVPEIPVPVVSDDELRKLLKTCEGPTFEDRRDVAMLRTFIESGWRLGEVAGLKVEDVDFEEDVVYVVGKGRRPRRVAFGAKTGQALDKYIRLRSRHPHASLPSPWLGPKGAMTESGVAQMLERRCAQAGMDKAHPHQFRHTAAHTWLGAGGPEVSAMRNFGWRSRTMLSRYGASVADERDRDEVHRLALGDRL